MLVTVAFANKMAGTVCAVLVKQDDNRAPTNAIGVAMLTPAQLALLLEGVDGRAPKRSADPQLAWLEAADSGSPGCFSADAML